MKCLEDTIVKRREVVRYFKKHGFVLSHGTKHDVYKHPDGRRVVVQRHVEITELMFKIMKKEAGLK